MPIKSEREISLRMDAGRSVLVLVDYQPRLMPAIADAERVLERAVFLAQVAAELGVPVVLTAQNPDKLGPNAPALVELAQAVVDKMTFGACEADLVAAVEGLRPDAEVVIAGCEAHVCLLQTALGLLEAGRVVWVVADASGSRRTSDHATAMSRLAQAGARVVSAEMVAFEWLGTAADPHFRAVSALVKGVPL